jgi:hypothetical protein
LREVEDLQRLSVHVRSFSSSSTATALRIGRFRLSSPSEYAIRLF